MKPIEVALVASLFQAPTGVAFTVSPDHAAVSSYTAYLVIGTNRIRWLDLGKPEPDAAAQVVVATPELFAGLEPGAYELYLTARNDAGESVESNRDALLVEAPPDPTPPVPPPPVDPVCYFQGIAYPVGAVLARATNRQNMNALIESFWGWIWDDLKQLHQNQYVLTFACR